VASGFAPQQRSGLSLTVGERQILNMQLRVGDAAVATFEVGGASPSIELGGTSVSTVVKGDTARELPLNGRDWTQLATLEPGISPIRAQPDPNGLNNRGNRGFGSQLSIASARSGRGLTANSIDNRARARPQQGALLQLHSRGSFFSPRSARCPISTWAARSC
jgi:hypothetical protein